MPSYAAPAPTYAQWEHRDSRGPDAAFAAALSRSSWTAGTGAPRDLRALLQLTLISRHELSDEAPPVIVGATPQDPNGLEGRFLGDPTHFGPNGTSDAASDSRMRASIVLGRTVLLLADSAGKWPDVQQYVKTVDGAPPSSGAAEAAGWPLAIVALGGLVTAGACFIAKVFSDKDERLATAIQQQAELLQNHILSVKYIAQRRAEAQAQGVPLSFDGFDASILGTLEKLQLKIANSRPVPPPPGDGNLFGIKLDLTAVAAIAAGVAAFVLLRK